MNIEQNPKHAARNTGRTRGREENTGGTLGVCLFIGSINSAKWTMFAVIFGGWIVTCLCAGLYWCFTGDLESQYRGFVGFCSNLGVYRIFWVNTGGLSEFIGNTEGFI